MIDFEALKTDLDEAFGPTAEEPVLDQYDDERPFLTDEDGTVVKDLPPIEDSFDFVDEELPETEELIKGVLHKGTKMIVGGGSKSFKTWTQMDLAVSVGYGLKWMGFDCQKGRVLFVNFEIKRQFFQKRLKKIMEARGVSKEKGQLDVWNLRGYSASYHVIIPQIIHRIKECGYALVVLDPIYKLYGNTDENSASDVAQMLNSLESVCVETDAAIVFGAHYSKGNQSAKEAIDRISGSGVFARDPDSILPFTKHEEDDSFVIEPILRNLPPIAPFVVSWNYPIMERNDDLDPNKLKAAGGRPKEYSAADILDLLPDSGLTHEKWLEKAVKTMQISERSFFRLKSELKDKTAIIFSRVDENWKPVRKQ